jgi:hypothetical protein
LLLIETGEPERMLAVAIGTAFPLVIRRAVDPARSSAFRLSRCQSLTRIYPSKCFDKEQRENEVFSEGRLSGRGLSFLPESV